MRFPFLFPGSLNFRRVPINLPRSHISDAESTSRRVDGRSLKQLGWAAGTLIIPKKLKLALRPFVHHVGALDWN
jgi:hypothetical protein